MVVTVAGETHARCKSIRPSFAFYAVVRVLTPTERLVAVHFHVRALRVSAAVLNVRVPSHTHARTTPNIYVNRTLRNRRLFHVQSPFGARPVTSALCSTAIGWLRRTDSRSNLVPGFPTHSKRARRKLLRVTLTNGVRTHVTTCGPHTGSLYCWQNRMYVVFICIALCNTPNAYFRFLVNQQHCELCPVLFPPCANSPTNSCRIHSCVICLIRWNWNCKRISNFHSGVRELVA